MCRATKIEKGAQNINLNDGEKMLDMMTTNLTFVMNIFEDNCKMEIYENPNQNPSTKMCFKRKFTFPMASNKVVLKEDAVRIG